MTPFEPNDRSRTEAQSPRKGWSAALAGIAIAAVGYVATTVGALDQVRTFLGWQSTAEGIKQATEALADLNEAGASVAQQKWAVDRLTLIARTHAALRPLLARRFADFVHTRCSSANRDGFTEALDGKGIAVAIARYDKQRRPRLGDDTFQYVLYSRR